MSVFFSVLFAGILTDNLMLSGLFGFEEVTKSEKNVTDILKKCGLISAVSLLAVLISYPIVGLLLPVLKLEVLSVFACVMIIGGILLAAFTVERRFFPEIYSQIKTCQDVSAVGVMSLALCLKPIFADEIWNFGQTILYSVAAMIGFLLVSLIFFGLSETLRDKEIPKLLKGLPITLLVAALLSMAFQGFVGI